MVAVAGVLCAPWVLCAAGVVTEWRSGVAMSRWRSWGHMACARCWVTWHGEVLHTILGVAPRCRGRSRYQRVGGGGVLHSGLETPWQGWCAASRRGGAQGGIEGLGARCGRVTWWGRARCVGRWRPGGAGA
ncbi:hypothetical protein EDB89DRAFT_1914690 [Lactarius sanguifluus]|nr:hypothetical protein EDB89DRAFT_1914690 [Lactarius sanguifluus]